MLLGCSNFSTRHRLVAPDAPPPRAPGVMTPRHHGVEDPVPRALRRAIARGWRGLTIVTGPGAGRPATIVRAGAPAAPSICTARVLVEAGAHGSGPAASTRTR